MLQIPVYYQDEKKFYYYQQLRKQYSKKYFENKDINEEERSKLRSEINDLEEDLLNNMRSTKEIATAIRESGHLTTIKSKWKSSKLNTHIAIYKMDTLCQSNFDLSKAAIRDESGTIEDVTCKRCLTYYDESYEDDRVFSIENEVNIICQNCFDRIRFRRSMYIVNDIKICRKCCREHYGDGYEEYRLERWAELSRLAIELLKEKDMSKVKSEFRMQFIPNVIEQFEIKGALSRKQYNTIKGMVSSRGLTQLWNKEKEVNYCPYNHKIL